MSDITLLETLEITISSMLIVFMILLLLAGVVSLFKYIPDSATLTKKYKRKRNRKFVSFENLTEEMKVAVLMATICCKEEFKKDVVLKSIRKL